MVHSIKNYFNMDLASEKLIEKTKVINWSASYVSDRTRPLWTVPIITNLHWWDSTTWRVSTMGPLRMGHLYY